MWRAQDEIKPAPIGGPAGLARAQVVGDECVAFQILGPVLVVDRFRIGIATRPEKLDELEFLYVGRKRFVDFLLRIGDDPANVLIRPIFEKLAELFARNFQRRF